MCAGRIKGARLYDTPPDAAGVGVRGVGDDVGELFAEGLGYVSVSGKCAVAEFDRLVWWGGGGVIRE